MHELRREMNGMDELKNGAYLILHTRRKKEEVVVVERKAMIDKLRRKQSGKHNRQARRSETRL